MYKNVGEVLSSWLYSRGLLIHKVSCAICKSCKKHIIPNLTFWCFGLEEKNLHLSKPEAEVYASMQSKAVPILAYPITLTTGSTLLLCTTACCGEHAGILNYILWGVNDNKGTIKYSTLVHLSVKRNVRVSPLWWLKAIDHISPLWCLKEKSRKILPAYERVKGVHTKFYST